MSFRPGSTNSTVGHELINHIAEIRIDKQPYSYPSEPTHLIYLDNHALVGVCLWAAQALRQIPLRVCLTALQYGAGSLHDTTQPRASGM